MEHNLPPARRCLAVAVLGNLCLWAAAAAHPLPQDSDRALGAGPHCAGSHYAGAHYAGAHESRVQVARRSRAAGVASAAPVALPVRRSRRISPKAPLKIDRTGRPRTGIASYYASYFAGRRMANGARMDPHGSNAASRTLPLGTVAKVTNLDTHRSAVVIIEDRGPYVRGRIVDLSPSTARSIGITPRAGIARVRVTPLTVPGQPLRIASAARNVRTLSASEAR